MEILNYSLGIDISKDKYDCCLSMLDSNRRIRVLGERTFENNKKGFQSTLDWLSSQTKTGIRLSVILEATGVYYENLAHYIYDNSNFDISVLLPSKAKYYFKSLALKTKTDKVDAKLLSQYGLERHSSRWKPISTVIRSVKQLCRTYRDLKIEINRNKNRLHAKQHAYKTPPLVIKLVKQTIKLLENQCLLIEVELKNLVFEDDYLSTKIDQLCSIPGIGFITAVSVVGETNGFELMKNAKQLCSYAGLDVKHNNSGNKEGNSRLSKKGNKYIRQAFYMPALTASRRIECLAKLYERINEKNRSKKVGLLAVSRKLLVLTYTLWKNDEEYKIV